ncbi:hypothetical protein SKAU_G00404350 [Synaphobranchus kaupii]|uniref:Uncharacterized protein n=1 Tax=Synaphobranchus kaupii TaxID=118154 RepID=A0A9Q1E9Q4_SYNKA|nr:hypothetical protein SKAU_G00404350 [Synaphobranchus kaupii]
MSALCGINEFGLMSSRVLSWKQARLTEPHSGDLNATITLEAEPEDTERAGEREMAARYLSWILGPTRTKKSKGHVWDWVNIRSANVWPKKLQELLDAIESAWTKIPTECFQHLVGIHAVKSSDYSGGKRGSYPVLGMGGCVVAPVWCEPVNPPNPKRGSGL